MSQRSPKHQALYNAAYDLFCRYGWTAVSIDRICRDAGTSRVTFYKYYADKHSLLQVLLNEHKNRIRAGFEALLERHATLEEVSRAIVAMQQESLSGLYSRPMLLDMEANQDPELQAFFAGMQREKYEFMRYFFHTLQQRHLLQEQLPPVLIDVFIRHTDDLLHHPLLQRHYADQPHQLRQDLLELILHGLAWRPKT